MFWRNKRIKVVHPDSGLRSTLAAAGAMAAARNRERANGTDGLDLLIAATRSKPVAKLIEKMAMVPGAIVERAQAAQAPSPEPGMTDDARRVMEATMARAVALRRAPTSIDLLVALVGTPGPARDVLQGMGLDADRLAPFVEGHS